MTAGLHTEIPVPGGSDEQVIDLEPEGSECKRNHQARDYKEGDYHLSHPLLNSEVFSSGYDKSGDNCRKNFTHRRFYPPAG
jgi:hypothetical protein